MQYEGALKFIKCNHRCGDAISHNHNNCNQRAFEAINSSDQSRKRPIKELCQNYKLNYQHSTKRLPDDF